MHISEGILPPSLLASAAAVAAAGVAVGIKRLEERDIPKTALFTAAFFVASLVHVPVGFSSAHLVLNGLLGIVLGWAAFPAILVGLSLQALLFQFGGLTTLGINTLNMALPAVLCGMAFRTAAPRLAPSSRVLLAALLGGASIILSGSMVAASLCLAGDSFIKAAGLILAAHLPVAVMESVVTGGVVAFLYKVKPEALRSPCAATLMALLMALHISWFCPPAAQAHKVNIFAWFDGTKIVGEAYYSRGRSAAGSKVELYDSKGKLITSGTTDANGQFQFSAPPNGTYEIRLYAGEGHAASASVEVGGENGQEAPPPQGAVSQGPAEDKGDTLCVERDELDKILSRRLKPIEREMRRLAEAQEQVTFQDIVSGLGYILGLMGTALFFKARNRQ